MRKTKAKTRIKVPLNSDVSDIRREIQLFRNMMDQRFDDLLKLIDQKFESNLRDLRELRMVVKEQKNMMRKVREGDTAISDWKAGLSGRMDRVETDWRNYRKHFKFND